MANTITQTTLMGGGSDRNIYRHISINSDGTEETGLVLFDNSAFGGDVTKGKIQQIWIGGAIAGLTFLWDQTTNHQAWAHQAYNSAHYDFRHFGGLPNPGATGATGDLLLATTGLDVGETFSIVIHIVQS